MIVGATGTRRGMTGPQQKAVLDLIALLEPTEAHHGDCFGADVEFHEMVKVWCLPKKPILHPMNNNGLRAFCDGDALPAKPPLERNHDIVDASDVMIAMPETMTEVLRSGTWATIRYTRTVCKPLIIAWPDGSLTMERLPVSLAEKLKGYQ